VTEATSLARHLLAGMSTHVIDMPDFFLKWIEPDDARDSLPVVMQASSGPCPLLALANVLLLRRDLVLPCSTTSIAPTTLLSAVASLPAACAPNTLDTLPALSSPVAVDPQFAGTTDFVHSNELDVFRVFGIRVVHGAIPDPQDPTVADAICPFSYNQVCDFLVASAVAAAEELAAADKLAASGPADSNPTVAVATLTSLAEQSTSGAPEDLGLDPCAPSVSDTRHAGGADNDDEDHYDLDFDAFELTPHLNTATTAEAACPAGPSVVGTDSSNLSSDRTASDGDQGRTEPSDGALVFENAYFVQEFLDSFPGMMSYYGLAQLHQTLESNELCVLFFNNHFSTLTKHGGYLYTLVTDSGYKDMSGIVWERLQDLDGNSSFYDAHFHRTVVGRPTTSISRQAPLHEKSTKKQENDSTSSTSPRNVQESTASNVEARTKRTRSKLKKGSSGCAVQ
jgi:ubiquitin carboxyl-terminal hydrolase MINDY-1/2